MIMKKTKTKTNDIKGTLRVARAALERDLLLGALREARGNISRAAAGLGVSRRQVQLKLREFDLNAEAAHLRSEASAAGFCTRCGHARDGGAS